MAAPGSTNAGGVLLPDRKLATRDFFCTARRWDDAMYKATPRIEFSTLTSIT
ncbi:hypothetical protein IFR04_012476, partial [Cadophora malorum]